MNKQQLKIMHEKKGFIAALDQSGGSTPKALLGYGVSEDSYHGEAEMYDVVHAMRTRIIKSPAFNSQQILGAILFENTMNKKIDGLYTGDYLWEKKGIVPFLKIDKGLKNEVDGIQLMKDMPDLDSLLALANKRNIFGTKMRSVINTDNEEAIAKVVAQQYEVAKKIISYGLVPIIEPEVNIHYGSKDKAEHLLLKHLTLELNKLGLDQLVIFKLTIPTTPNLYVPLMKDPRVVRVVALSGGYSRDHANDLLKLNHGLIASFSRALAESLRYQQSEQEFDATLKEAVDSIYSASIV